MGLIHLDAGVLIGLLDENDAHHHAAVQVVGEALRSNNALAMSASAYAECLVAPSRSGAGAVAAFQRLLDRIPIRVVSIDTAIAADAAGLRARRPTLRLPDALVVAAARLDGADTLVTTDARWPSVDGISVTVIGSQPAG